MLSKSQAKAFFLFGTILFAAVFIGLTIDTLNQNKERTKEQNLTDSVKRGKLIWESKNCMGCHTLLGEGAYYAPDLTKVVERRGPAWIKIFINDPQAMFPNQRKMVKYNFSEQEKEDLISFLKWVGEIDTNDWPPKPDIEYKPLQASISPSISDSKQPEKFSQLCIACHAVGGKGGLVGPSLDKVGSKYDKTYLLKWLSDPQSIKPGTAMPKLPLSESEVNEVADYLLTLK